MPLGHVVVAGVQAMMDERRRREQMEAIRALLGHPPAYPPAQGIEAGQEAVRFGYIGVPPEPGQPRPPDQDVPPPEVAVPAYRINPAAFAWDEFAGEEVRQPRMAWPGWKAMTDPAVMTEPGDVICLEECNPDDIIRAAVTSANHFRNGYFKGYMVTAGYYSGYWLRQLTVSSRHFPGRKAFIWRNVRPRRVPMNQKYATALPLP